MRCGKCDWNPGVPACNAVASVASNLSDSTSPEPFRASQWNQARTPAFQSHPPFHPEEKNRRKQFDQPIRYTVIEENEQGDDRETKTYI
jgi:hypothetical protein